LSSDFANTTFELFAFTESPRDKHVSAVRVHALGQPRGPDVDFVLAARRRKRSAKIERASVVHEVPAGEKGPLNTSGPQPAPAAVARALIRGGSDDFQVETSSGTWWVSPTSGAIRR
jgi:hypothetical protein